MNADIVFDEGVQCSLMSVKLATELQVRPITTTQVALSSLEQNHIIPISVLIVPTIATPLCNSCHLHLDSLPHLRGLKLANPTHGSEFTISILIGTNHYWSYVEDQIIRGNGPTAQQSYLLSGPVPHPSTQLSASIFLQISTMTEQAPNLDQLWEVEAVVVHPQESNSTFLSIYRDSSIYQLPNGICCTKFPWKEDKPYLSTNFTICQRRTKTLLTKLRASPNLLQMYNNIIQEQERCGVIE